MTTRDPLPRPDGTTTTTTPDFVGRVMASVETSARPSAPRSFLDAARGHSLHDAVASVVVAAHLVLSAPTVPRSVRAQALALVAVVAMMTGAGATFAATTAYQVAAPIIGLGQPADPRNERTLPPAQPSSAPLPGPTGPPPAVALPMPPPPATATPADVEDVTPPGDTGDGPDATDGDGGDDRGDIDAREAEDEHGGSSSDPTDDATDGEDGGGDHDTAEPTATPHDEDGGGDGGDGGDSGDTSGSDTSGSDRETSGGGSDSEADSD